MKISTRSLRFAVHRLLGLKTTQLESLKLLCSPPDVTLSVAKEIIRGGYELAERQLARQALRPGDKVLEIGSGVGVVGLLCASIVGDRNVTLYEANPALEPTIRRNFALNGMTPHLVLKAVTVDGGPVTFFQNENVISSSIYDRKLESRKIEVGSDAINTVLAARQATVIVMDVEGAEVGLLQSADLAGVREIIVEVHPKIVGADATEQMLTHLRTLGFERRARHHNTEWFSRARGAAG